ncbi:probable ATP-dependent RNA helicase DDX10 isoform X1 [Monodon monoceros]|uniref:probable ATP-dependent RNA helicase DDX10 isoform X1 n=1 Tax=Monodon monoceros TaxID=40151 RepID=UPI0010F5B9E7|nr:probable ATP-dependent RNA helicase DDX10 isoform X1 [Monodon monoceros]
MGKTSASQGPGARPDPVRSFNRWKKKHSHKQSQKKQLRKQLKKPEWQVEREVISRLMQNFEKINVNEITRFSDFPLSKKTLKGLQEAQYRLVTEIQKQTIGLALRGKDVLGAAKTGSGKTLAFLVPVLEGLYRLQWTSADGLGALIISPTRELAYQTFEVLRKVGKNHDFSAGLIIGGKLASLFLVLDEADRILDMGFADTMNAIIENLPKKRQTLLFSATQTKSVKDLARLSLKNPEYVWVHEKAKYSTPATLEQNYIVCELQQKISVLYSFLRSHLKKKSIVFFSSCKEVQYLYRVFCRLRPGISILALHGRQQQMRRMEVYDEFVGKRAAVLFATDLAARGLDFPAVNWVLQFDCPEDANTYIHRAGRTARYREDGEALLILLPSEEKGMVQQLLQKKVPVKEIKINPEKLTDIQKKLESLLAQDQDLKERAQRCFVSYIRSVYLMKDKEIFDVSKLPIPEYALSLGLAVAPRVRFLQRMQKQPNKELVVSQDNKVIEPRTLSLTNDEVEEFRAYFNEKMSVLQKGGKIPEGTEYRLASGISDGEEEEKECEQEMEEKLGKTKGSQPQSVSSNKEPQKNKEVPVQFLDGDDDEEEDGGLNADFFKVKRRNVFGLDLKENKTLQKKEPSKCSVEKKVTKVAEAKKVMKRNFKVNKKITFTDEGELVQQWPQVQKSVSKDTEEEDDAGGINLDKAKERLQEEDKFDKEEYRKKIKAKHREKRLKEREARREASKKQAKAKVEEEAFLDWSDDDNDGFDPSTLPDPDKYRSSEESDNEDMENKISDTKKKQAMRKKNNSEVEDVGPTSHDRKKTKWETSEPLDTGLSLAEDEELVLHLLKSQS